MEDKVEVKTELLPLVYYELLWIICYVTLAISFLGDSAVPDVNQ